MACLPSDVVAAIFLAIERPFDSLAASQVCQAWRGVFLSQQYGICRHECSKLFTPVLTLMERFTRWSDGQAVSDSGGNWYLLFVNRLQRTSHCLSLLDKVVAEPTST